MGKNIKISLLLALLLSLISACGQQMEQDESVQNPSEVAAEEEEETFIPSTEEEWQATLEGDAWYTEAVGDREILFGEFIDFNGDGMEEYIMGTNSIETKIARLDIGQYDADAQEWHSVRSEVHEFSMLVEPKFHGVLDNGVDGEVAIVSTFIAGGSHVYERMKLMAIRPMKDRLIIVNGFEDENQSHEPPHTYSINNPENSFTISGELGESTYRLDEGKLYKDDNEEIQLKLGNPVTLDEEFINLLNNSFFESGIYFGDRTDDAKQINPGFIIEGEVEGGFTVEYEDYALIHGYDDPYISMVALYNFDDLSVEELEKVLDQEIEITTYFNEMEGREIHTAEFVLGDYRYSAEVSSNGKEAPIEIIYITQIPYSGE